MSGSIAALVVLISRVFFFWLMGGLLTFSAWAEDWRQLAPGLELREFLVPDATGDLGGAQAAWPYCALIRPVRCGFGRGALFRPAFIHAGVGASV